MVKVNFRTKIDVIIVVSFLLLGNFGGYVNILDVKTLSERNTDILNGSYSKSLQDSTNEPTSGLTQENLAIQSSGIISEKSDDFLEGTLLNLTVYENQYLCLTKNVSDNWWEDVSSPGPLPRDRFALAYDNQNQKAVLFGGWDAGTEDDETWVYDLPTYTWTQMYPASQPGERNGLSMVYHSQLRKFILFGGFLDGGYLDETWVYDLSTNNWTQMSPVTSPSPRVDHSMVYDRYHDKVVLFGGNSGLYNDETWIYDLLTDTWTQMFPLFHPTARAEHSMVYDSTTKKIILFGGYLGNQNDETWVYDLTLNNWTQMNPIIKPSARFRHSMIYDSNKNRVTLVGGRNGTMGFDETWHYDYLVNNWTPVFPLVKLRDRSGHSMIYDEKSAKIMLFGGTASTGAPRLGDTWIYPVNKYFQNGRFYSKLTPFGNIYKIQGEITWIPPNQPLNTSLICRIGFSNTTREEDFAYTAYHPSGFTFTGVAQYMRYQIIFESDERHISSPILERVTIYYSLENPKPTVQITNPQTNSIIKGLVVVSAIADSPNGIEKVCFYFDGLFFSCDYSAPYNCSWNSESSENGYISLMVVVVSMLGEENADSIQILVDNPVVSVPSIPQSLSAIPEDNFVVLSWSAPSDDGGSTIMSYRIYRGTTTGEYMLMGITTTTSFNDTLVLGETTYYYVVTAVNAVGESYFSNEVIATPTGTSIPKSGSFPSFLFVLVFLGSLVVVTRKFKKA